VTEAINFGGGSLIVVLNTFENPNVAKKEIINISLNPETIRQMLSRS
jgi:hypothetical protein